MSVPDGLLFADVIDWLVVNARAAVKGLSFDVTVEDGTGISLDTGTYVHVGTVDPFSTSIDGAAEADQEWPLATQQARTETGTVVLSIESTDNGTDDAQKVARDRVVEVGRLILALIRRDTRMGIDGVLKTSSGDIDYDQGPTDDGAAAVLVIHVKYDARIRGGLQ